jgi:hypothetical protein
MANPDLSESTMAARVPEAFVSWAWEHRHYRPDLATTDGRAIQVVYPGRRGGSWGPDFRGALMVLGGQLVRGDVEVHLRPRNWTLHRHDRDPAYASTILHVVLEDQPGVVCRRSDGTVLPTLVLDRALSAPLALLLRRWQAAPHWRPPLRPCRTAEEAAALLDEAGMTRFLDRVERFEADLSAVPSGQALWAGLCEALGYARNRAPFRALADRVDAEEAMALARLPHAASLQAVLFGEAGLLPQQRGRSAPDQPSVLLEQLWSEARRTPPATPLGWRWIGVRPTNQPVRRVAAASLLVRASPVPIAERVLAVLATSRPSLVARTLGALTSHVSDPYWDAHHDFGVPLRRPAALIGAARAREITVNILLPWATAVARITRQPDLEAAAVWAYRHHPLLAENTVTRHMRWQLVGPEARRVVTTACRQQGLHHLFGTWCDGRDCEACLAGDRFGAVVDCATD